MKTLLRALENRSENTVLIISIVFTLLLSTLSLFLDSPITIFPFFVLPVLLVSWYGGNKAGILLSFFTVSIILIFNYLSYTQPIDNYLLVFSAVSLLVTCLLLAILVTNFQKVHKIEVVAANRDELTGAFNMRAFHVELANEIFRSIRYKHIFTLAYIDIDNFKYINDTFGHSVGDRLLINVAKTLKNNLRKTDVISRLGGDEFACLFPESSLDDAKSAFAKASKMLKKGMKDSNWPVTFSVGIVTFEALPEDIKQAMSIADELMYTVKNSKKNNVAYQIWKGNA